MSRAFASELLKLRTTRTFLALVASAALLVARLSALGAALGSWGPGDARRARTSSASPSSACAFALVLGLLAVRRSSATARSRRRCWPSRAAGG